MKEKLMNKIRNKKGGLKELVYDNTAMFLVVVLIIAVIVVGIVKPMKDRGDKVTTQMEVLEETIQDSIPDVDSEE